MKEKSSSSKPKTTKTTTTPATTTTTPATTTTMTSPPLGKVTAGSFQSMGLEKEILQGLRRMNYNNPTPVQRKALPIVLAGLDIVCMARTGSVVD
eukprot:scaffold6314_cov273-Ochromonas_danica.AAC.20